MITTRFAPAPTGSLHLGHVADAIWVWGAARALGGRVLVRIEDHDRIRSRPAYHEALLEDLAWLGFEPDAPPVRQSDREPIYVGALERLAADGLVYACDCTRREILEREPRDGAAELRYPGTCRDRRLPGERSPIRRIRLEREEITFSDALAGAQVQVPSEQCGDLLARDRDGNWTYQFAVTVDDLEQGIDFVVRGADLLASTGR
ncbi:MAG TPA: glutamate--tRNA ligase family protein, partial [Thermoanaerobaculia bacterium]|nr:glutamate--tRNA ligase family protein [Thermoanaerobaculia bacterium]